MLVMPQKKDQASWREMIFLILTFAFVYFWTNNPVLSVYNLQLTALLITTYFILRLFFNRKPDFVYQNLFLNTLALSAVLLLIISVTGGLSSPLFFILYFYLFAFALLFEPLATLVLTLALALFFLKELNSVNTVFQLLSVFLFAPLAIFSGRQYLKLLESQDKIKVLHKEKKELSAISNLQSASLSNEETNSLLWLSLEFKDSLLRIIHHSAELLADLGHLTLSQKEHLTSIRETAKTILKSGEKLQEKIDRETDG